MRCYALYITSNKILSNVNLLFGNKAGGRNDLILAQNCFGNNEGIAIDFDLQTIAGNDNTNKSITLYNVNRYWLGEEGGRKLKGKKIILYAGTKLTPTLINQNVYSNEYQSSYIMNDFQLLKRPLFSGYIQSTYNQVENGTTALILSVITTAQDEEKQERVNLKLPADNLKIPSGAVWFPIVKSWIVKYYLKKLALPPIIKKGKITNTTSLAEINIDNIRDIMYSNSKLSLQKILENNFGCTITIQNNGVIIISDKDGKKENDIGKKLNIVSDGELLTQPSIMKYSDKEHIILTLPLTNRFELNSEFSLISKSATSFSQVNSVIGDTIIRYDMSKNVIGKYFANNYKVIQTWHQGSSRNSDVNAWITKLECQYENNTIDNIKDILKKIYKKSWLG